jgi:antitoxin component YwqK of YwqJK toxin-antitoxin module
MTVLFAENIYKANEIYFDKVKFLYLDEKSNKPITGVVKTYYPDGTLQTESPYKNGIEDGVYKSYYESGVLESEQTYKNWRQVGIGKTYYKSGAIQNIYQYKDGIEVGVRKSYYESGALNITIPHSDEEANGVAKWYYESGEILGEITFKNGRSIKGYKYNKNGKKTALSDSNLGLAWYAYHNLKDRNVSVAKEIVVDDEAKSNNNDAEAYFKQGLIADSLEQSLVLYEKSCDRHYAIACSMLGILYYKGSKETPQNYFKAAEYHQKACNNGSAEGCYNAGFMCLKGEGGKLDYVKAKNLFQKSCDGDISDGCLFLGALYEEGKGTEINEDKALEIYGELCDSQFQKGCDAYARLKEYMDKTKAQRDIRDFMRSHYKVKNNN